MNKMKYQDVQTQILKQIDNGTFLPNQKLPSDYALAEMFQCSRLTIRKAIDGLIQQQKIVKYPGKGNYVMQHAKIQSGANGLQSFTERACVEGKTAQTNILQIDVLTDVPSQISQIFLKSDLKEMIHLVRLRSLAHEPMTLENIYIPRTRLSDDKNLIDFSGSLYDEIEKVGAIGYAQQEIEAIKCPATIAKLLSIAADEPVLFLKAITYTPDGRPIMYETSYYRGDKYTFKQITSRQR